MTDELPDRVRELVNARLSSMDHVELLLLLRDRASDAHTLATLSAASRLDERTVSRVLDDLAGAGLLARTGDVYRFEASANDRATIAQLAELYHTRPVTLVRAVHARPAPLTSFAQAFRSRDDTQS